MVAVHASMLVAVLAIAPPMLLAFIKSHGTTGGGTR